MATSKKTQQQKIDAEAIAALERLGGITFKEENVLFEGTKIVLPSGSSIPEVKKQLDRFEKENEEIQVWSHRYLFRPLDGAHATERALRKAFGGINNEQTMGFWGPEPPHHVDVEIGVNETASVPWGAISVPGMPDVIFTTTGMHDEERGTIFILQAEGPKRRRFAVEGVFKLVEAELQEHSIYRGKVIDGAYSFVDTSRVDPDKVVYSAETQAQLEAKIFARIRYPELLAKRGVEQKGSVLLHGTFGVGKTLAAYLTAQEAEKHGVTFILVRPTRDSLEEAMQTAAMYEPSVVFFEDVDAVTSADSERERIIAMLDLFDGVRAKGKRVLGVFTTNNVELIHAGMLRPGRIDAVIEVPPPDAGGIQRLLEVKLGDELAPITKAQWKKVTDEMEGFLPAFVAQAADDSQLYLLSRTMGEPNGAKITHDDLIFATVGLKAQLKLMSEAGEEPTPDRLGDVFRGAIEDVLEDRINPIGMGEMLNVNAPVIREKPRVKS